MSRPLRVLLVEDSADDAALITRELVRSGYALIEERVETAEKMQAMLQNKAWDIILSDFSMPTFSATAALALLKESGRDIPFIIVSGTIGEETAVASLKAGAHDFLVKNQLARLVPAIERELREARVRRARRLAEDALRRSEERFRAIMDTATDGVISADESGNILTVNPAVERMFGYATADLLGEPLTLLMPERFQQNHRAGLVRLLVTGEGRMLGRKIELVGRRKDGTEFPLDLSLGSWISEGKRYFAGFLQDISGRKTVEAQLLIAERMAAVGILAAGVAHEINNPLAAVVANLDLALEAVDGRGTLEGNLQLVQRLEEATVAAERVRQTVRDLKIFSRGDDETRGPVNVERVMESTLRMAWNELRHRAKLVKRYGGVPLVEASEARLGQVFLNLVMNAVQALPEAGTEGQQITITTRTTGDRVAVEVSDTGTGISPEVLARLFTPFVTTKPVGVGTGLGLSICHRIVTELGGEIAVETELGKGTTFRVFLPASKTLLEVIAPPAKVAPKAAAKRGRVLVVDDEPMLAGLVETVLRDQQEVVVRERAREALDLILLGERFDVLLCDLMMPGMTGIDLYQELLVQAPDQAARVVFMTGGAFTQHARSFLDTVANPRLEKPFRALELRALISGLLSAAEV